MPQDLKLDIDQLSREDAETSARYLAEVVGKAHGREFSASLRTNKSSSLDAPSWLWSSVVDWAATHEAAYLEHRRRYALQSA